MARKASMISSSAAMHPDAYSHVNTGTRVSSIVDIPLLSSSFEYEISKLRLKVEHLCRETHSEVTVKSDRLDTAKHHLHKNSHKSSTKQSMLNNIPL